MSPAAPHPEIIDSCPQSIVCFAWKEMQMSRHKRVLAFTRLQWDQRDIAATFGPICRYRMCCSVFSFVLTRIVWSQFGRENPSLFPGRIGHLKATDKRKEESNTIASTDELRSSPVVNTSCTNYYYYYWHCYYYGNNLLFHVFQGDKGIPGAPGVDGLKVRAGGNLFKYFLLDDCAV